MKGVNPNICTQDGDPPLVLALSLKYLKCKSGILNRLLDADADVNLTNPANGITPLMKACVPSKMDSQNVRLLIGAGADLEQQDTHGRTAIHYCGSRGNLATVKILLKAGASTNAIDHEGNSPLASLISSASELSIPNLENARQLLPLLLEYGANPNLSTPMFNPDMLMSMATCLGYTNVQELLASGAEPSSIANDQHTEQPLSIAIRRKNFEVAHLLIDGLFYKNNATCILEQYTKEELVPPISALLKKLQEFPSLLQQCRRAIHRAILPTTSHRWKHVENFPIGRKLQRYILYKY